jgi:ELWxxDGT repeat protein
MIRRAAISTLVLLSILIANLAAAGTPRLVLDINSVATPLSSYPSALGRLGNTALFRVDLWTGAGTRTDLVTSDGTSAGTKTLKTFAGYGPIGRTMTIGSRAFFDAKEDSSSDQIWVTDGTSAGTRQVTSLPASSAPPLQLVAAYGNDLLFARYIDGGKYQLYRTDGTAAGTTAIAPVSGYGSSSSSIELAVVGNKIYFVATSDDTQQTELWVSDGTAAGTHKIPAVTALGRSLSIYALRALNGGVVFFTSTGIYGSELTRVDASETLSIIDLAPGIASGAVASAQLVVMGGYAYFGGSSTGMDPELWRSDGTLGGTTLVKDINAGPGNSLTIADFLQVGNRLVFMADDGGGTRLWGSDGTAAGTVALTNVVSFPPDALRAPIAADSVRYQYIRTYIAGYSTTLITDGTPGGTGIVPYPTPTGNPTQLLAAAGDATTEYVEIANVNNSTGVTTYEISRFTPPSQYTTVYSSTSQSGTGAFVYLNGKLLFDGFDQTAGQELLVSDENGTRLLSDFTPESSTYNSSPAWFMDWNGKAAFVANDGVHGSEIWISDGSAAGTRLLVDSNPGAVGSDPRLLTVWNGALYFFANDGTSYRLMRMTAPDATPEGLATANPPLRFNDPGAPEPVRCTIPNAAPLGNKLLFSARTAEAGTELWATDGTAAGTAMIVDINTNTYFGVQPMGSQPCGLTVFQNRVYFGADATADGSNFAMWSSDGTAAGTKQFSTLANAGSFVVYKNELYFRATDSTGTLGGQTWRTDGTAAGTRTLVTATSANDKFDAVPLAISNGKLFLYNVIVPGNPPGNLTFTYWSADGTSSAPVQLVANVPLAGAAVTADRLYFTNNAGGDEEPWVSDGTSAGTHRLADLDSAASSHPYAYMDFRGVAVILTNDSTGPHAWRTDGTESGTIQIGKIPPRGPLLTSGVAGQNLFFNAVDDLRGDELYVISNDSPVSVADSANATNGQAITISVLSNDADPDGALDASSTRIAQAPAHGTTSVDSNGIITYTPSAGYSGSDTFTYTVADKQGSTSNTATVTLTVTAAPPSGGSGGGDGGGGSGGSGSGSSGGGGGGGGGGGSGGSGGGGGGGPLRWYDVLMLAALAGWKLAGKRALKKNDARWMSGAFRWRLAS